ncbi:MAG: glycosyltransferase [Prevotella sp.]|jgi:glycosyltransferase involved in cell wall biosynthesis|nr:glycosyltransferase [Prevotella sp.]
MTTQPLVSVCMITYNQERFISQAIEGVVIQKTDFPVELVIGEDCSTDNTRAICMEYKEKYPDKIKLLLPEKNLGMIRNFLATLQSCTGKYIALCEGDDYWTDPLKLQKQIDFLEANPDFSICFHPVKVLKGDELVDDYITRETSDVSDIYELSKGNYMHTPSVVFRKEEKVFEDIAGLGDLPIGDYVIHLLNAQYGKIKKLPDIMAVYRADVGIWSADNGESRSIKWLDALKKLIRFFEKDDELSYNLKYQYGETAFALHIFYKNKNNAGLSKRYFIEACNNSPETVYREYAATIAMHKKELYKFQISKTYRLGAAILKPVWFMRKLIMNF